MSLHTLGLLPESVRPTTNGYLVPARATAPAATLAPPRAIDGEAVVRLLAAAGVRHVRLEFADLHGIARSKLLPLARFGKVVEEGTAFYGGMLHSDARGDDLGPAAYPGGPPTLPDYLLTPDLTTLAVLHPDHAPLPRTLEEALDVLAADEPLRDLLPSPLVELFLTVKRDEAARCRAAVADFDQPRFFARVDPWEVAEYGDLI